MGFGHITRWDLKKCRAITKMGPVKMLLLEHFIDLSPTTQYKKGSWIPLTDFLSYILPTTLGSKSTKTALGTCFPVPVSEKKVLKESSPPPMVSSEGI